MLATDVIDSAYIESKVTDSAGVIQFCILKVHAPYAELVPTPTCFRTRSLVTKLTFGLWWLRIPLFVPPCTFSCKINAYVGATGKNR